MLRDFATVEVLESRRLFTGASVAHGVLRVYGDPLNDNTITIARSADLSTVNVTINYVTPAHVSKTFTAAFPATSSATKPFSKINIYGGKRADTINIDETAASLGVSTRIDTGRGGDTLNLGSEKDVVYAGAGNDTIHAGSGNDLIYGGAGDDSISGDNGNDTLWGGSGNDTVDGGAGDDKLGGVVGANVMTGDDGSDTFVVKSLAAETSTDYNSATDHLVTKDSTDDVDAPSDADAMS